VDSLEIVLSNALSWLASKAKEARVGGWLGTETGQQGHSTQLVATMSPSFPIWGSKISVYTRFFHFASFLSISIFCILPRETSDAGFFCFCFFGFFVIVVVWFLFGAKDD
jgi:hypothetical protein